MGSVQVCVTDKSVTEAAPDLRSAGDLAPDLARPWVVRMRFGMLAAQLALLVFLGAVLHVKLPLGWLAVPLSITAVSNFILLRKFVLSRNPQVLLGQLFCLDTVCLTVVLGLTGGPANPFSLLYLVQIMLSAMILSAPWTWVIGILSTCCFGVLFFFNNPVPALSPHHDPAGPNLHLGGMWIAFMIAAALITLFIGKVAEEVRRHEREVLNLRDRLARSQRLASLVTLAAGAAHELGSPLGTIAVASKELERAAELHESEAILDDARLIRAEVARCRGILERMSAESAETPGEASLPVPLSRILAEIAEQFGRHSELRVPEAPADAVAVLPRQATVQAVSALVQNALDSNVHHRPVTLRAEIAGGNVRFVVVDQGSGMSPDVLSHIAEPFFTTKHPGRGMGLGTFLVRIFAEHLHGRLSFDSSVGKGSTAVLEFPAAGVRNASA